MDFMQIIEINPRDCTRWKYADRSHFEFGNTGSLSEDIKENGQVEGVLCRKVRIFSQGVSNALLMRPVDGEVILN
jgi:hypothetical protein